MDIYTSLYEGKIAFRESALFKYDKNGIAKIKLLHKAKKIIHIENLSGAKKYIENVDFIVDGEYIVLTHNTKIIALDSYFPKTRSHVNKSFYKHIDGEPLFFLSNGGMQNFQVFITYEILERTHIYKPQKCTYSYLFKNNSSFKMVIYGDSISAGHDCSSVMNVEPFTPNYSEQLKILLEDKYNIKIELINSSCGGKDSNWAVQNFGEKVLHHNPDFLIIAFGMNDGTERICKEIFYNNIKEMVEEVDIKTQIILISTMLPTPYSATKNNVPFFGKQKEYLPVLKRLVNDRVSLFNMTAIHEDLLKHKKHEDMQGNNINHPNDYLTRYYAQGLFALFS